LLRGSVAQQLSLQQLIEPPGHRLCDLAKVLQRSERAIKEFLGISAIFCSRIVRGPQLQVGLVSEVLKFL
jgi:hypothetical protein